MNDYHSKGGISRMNLLTQEEKSALGKKAYQEKINPSTLRETHFGVLRIGDKSIHCSVVKNEKGEIISKNTEIVVITAYPDTEQKMSYLNELIDNVTSFGYDIMISTHYSIPDTVKNKVTYNVVDCTDNLLYKEEYEKHGVVNIIYNVTDDRKLIKSTDYTHGYAVWTLWENAVLYLKEIDWYDKIIYNF